MKKYGYDGPPIDVVMREGTMYVVDGHHRLAASKMAGLKEVPVNIVDDIAGHKSTWSTVQEVVEDAATVGANNIRIKGKRVEY